ncbi:hypothetical protein B0T18DRAFT_395873 [Schizothecium vesticola]|uniref:Uncharacterized protein n=1 Tax=Schizothecium vesticola TaxID=314040 RepID=A0AA40KBG4_9PEZI|nr:hypothetical protein B0T18DRAFT_395873 [Schizothecium vesticola]
MHAAPVLVRNLAQDPLEVSNQGRRTPPRRPTIRWSGGKSKKYPWLAPGTRLARWFCVGGEGGRVLGVVGTWDGEGVRRGVGGSEAGPLSTTRFSDRDGSTAVCPPSPGREAPRSMMSTRLRGPGKPAAGLLTAQRSLFRSRSSQCQQTSTPHLFSTRLAARTRPWSLSQAFLPAPDGCLTRPALLPEFWEEAALGGIGSDAGQWAQQLKAAWERGTWRGLLRPHWPPVADRIACGCPVASIGRFRSTWSAILALRNLVSCASCTKNKLCRQEARVGEGRGEEGRGERGRLAQ